MSSQDQQLTPGVIQVLDSLTCAYFAKLTYLDPTTGQVVEREFGSGPDEDVRFVLQPSLVWSHRLHEEYVAGGVVTAVVIPIKSLIRVTISRPTPAESVDLVETFNVFCCPDGQLRVLDA